MQTLFSEENLKYDGSQLASHFAYRRFGLLGDSCVAFLGPCEVALPAMVDLEDVRRQAPIFSREMLHFVAESFAFDLKAAGAFQRLMVATVQAELTRRGLAQVRRRGDDLYVGDGKLSVSIATVSPVSTLIHLGLNVVGEGAPVRAVGLQDLGMDPGDFGGFCLKAFAEEYQGILRATTKVRSVE
jgi:hypothetical protein